MPNLNRVFLMGNLTRDPEAKFLPNGTAICEFGMAINHTYTANGEKREDVTFIDVTFFGKPAEVITEHVKKGRPLYVEGRLKLDTWDDKQSGQKRSKMRVVGDQFQFLGDKQGGKSEAAPPPKSAARPATRPSDPDLGPDDEDSSVPF